MFQIGSRLSVLLLVLLPVSAMAQTRLLTLDVAVGAKEELGIEQRLMESLADVGADNVKILKGNQQPNPAVQEIQGGRVTTVRITAVLQGRTLYLPGAKFAMNDRAGIAGYLKSIRDDGAEIALAEKKAFGLTSDQLVELHAALSFEISDPTANEDLRKWIADVSGRLPYRMVVTEEAERAMSQSGPIRDELKGCSAGTALALALRPAGLVLAPRRSPGQEVELSVLSSRDAEAFWPIGWPNENPVGRVAPSLLERLDVEIQDFVLADALAALQRRVKLPMYIDRNELAEKEIDPQAVTVTYIKKRAQYLTTFNKILAQTRPSLSLELRVDEAGRPFLWIF